MFRRCMLVAAFAALAACSGGDDGEPGLPGPAAGEACGDSWGEATRIGKLLFALDGELFVVSKEIPSVVYRFDGPLKAGSLNRPVPSGVVNAGERLVLGSTTDDERLLLTSSTRTDSVYVHEITEDAANPVSFLKQAPVFDRPMEPSQREAGDFYPRGGCDIVLVSENQSVWLLRNKP